MAGIIQSMIEENNNKTEENVWFLTDATRGLGIRIARAALDAGHQVVATGRNTGAMTEALGAYPELLALPLDVTCEVKAQEAVAAALGRSPRGRRTLLYRTYRIARKYLPF